MTFPPFNANVAPARRGDRAGGFHMHRLLASVAALTISTLALYPLSAGAQIVVSANDNKVANVEGRTTVIENPPADTVDIINFNVMPPKIIGTVNAPTSVVGPPSSVALAPDESFAL